MAREQRRLAAILAADVVGYSRLMGRDEAGTLARLREIRRERLEPIVARRGGRVVKLTGDGALVEFASAVEALSAAIEFQQAMREANARTGDNGAMSWRIGLHLGDIIVADNDLYGDGVNVAARLEAEAEPGGIVISGAVHDAVVGRLKASFDAMGVLTLKNIERPVPGFRIVWQAADWNAPTVVPCPAAPRAIPTALAPADPAATRAMFDKPSIAVLPFANMSGDPEQEYFADGIAEDIITELSRFREFAVIARNSTFTYKAKAVDVAQVGRELGVEHVLEGSVRRAGSRVRVTAQLVRTSDSNHLWAERYDRELDDVFTVQEEITRAVVASISSQLPFAEPSAQLRSDRPSEEVRRLTWRSGQLIAAAMHQGSPAEILQAIDVAQQATAMDAKALEAHFQLAAGHLWCHLLRWGPEPERALDRAWSVVERMMQVDPTDRRTLSASGSIRVARGDVPGGISDLRRAIELYPNGTRTLISLAIAEARAGMSEEASSHALLALRLSPRDPRVGDAQTVVAMAAFTRGRYEEAARWAELAIQSQPKLPIRRALMIACTAEAGDLARAKQELEVLCGFAPDFIASLFRGENQVFSRQEDMQRLLQGLRKAGVGA